ncbi:MAG: hypothetical protein ACK4UN_05170 [Limisphaerales bacterium]
MEPNWAAENLQVIRTLMERSSLYRRALAPVMIFAGLVGTVASALGWFLDVSTAQNFTRFWVAAGLIAVAGAFLLMRRQALKDREPVWSSPTRRVAQAAAPAFFVGFVASIPVLLFGIEHATVVWWLLPIWFALYGCALCSAGFFMPRGIKIFGWFFVCAGCALFIAQAVLASTVRPLSDAHLLMGMAFGVIHLLYGGYLYVTEQQRKNAA